MKRIIAIGLSFCLLFAAGCKKGGEGTSSSSPEEEGPGEYPLSVKDEYGFNVVEDVEIVYNNDDTNEQSSKPNSPFLIDSAYPNDDVPIAIENVKDFGAKGDGVTDDTSAFKAAIRTASAMGGGSVYVPAGRYVIRETVPIPEMVTLRGDWSGPDSDGKLGNGTVILAYVGRGQEKGGALFDLAQCCGVMNMTIYYPEQDPSNVVPYTPTIEGREVVCTIKNVWLVNSYRGIVIGEVAGCALPTVENVYGSPLNTGVFINNCFDIGRNEGVYMSPKYYQLAVERGIVAPEHAGDQAALEAYMYEHATGLKIGKSDWQYTYNLEVEGCLNGMLLYRTETLEQPEPGTGQATNMKLIGNKYGVYIKYIGDTNGYTISNTEIVTSGKPDSYCIYIEPGAPYRFFNLTLSAPGGQVLYAESAGDIAMSNSKIKEWDANRYAIEAEKGNISLLQCSFEQAGKAVHLASGCQSGQVLGCTFAGEPDIAIDVTEGAYYDQRFQVSHEPLNIAVQSGKEHQYKKTLPRPHSARIYYLYDYGAMTGQDITEALKKALEDAGKTGGTVYIPGGRFTIRGEITIPEGVELRGCADTNFHTKGGGTVLEVYPTDKGNEDGKAFITLSPNSGVRGFSIAYPEQDFHNPIAYPWSVQSKGTGTWAININLINSWRGLDFSTYRSDNHYISYVTGAPISVGISIGNNAGNGWLENCHFNPSFWFDTYYTADFDSDTYWNEFDAYLTSHLTAFEFGYCESEHVLGNFVYAAFNGMLFREQEGLGKFNGLIINHAVDSGVHSTVVEDCELVEICNSMLVTLRTPAERNYLLVGENNTGEVRIFAMTCWPLTDVGIRIGGGKVIVQHGMITGYRQAGLLVSGGEVEAVAMNMSTTKHVTVEEGAESVRIVAFTSSRLNYETEKALTCENAAGDRFQEQFSIVRESSAG